MKFHLHSSRQRRHRTASFHIPWMPLLAFLSLGAVGAALVVLFPLEWAKKVDVSARIEYSAFSPNGDGQRDTALLTYALSDDATVTIKVLDKGQHPVRVLLSEAPQSAGQHVAQWEGLNDVGLPVPDGKYYFQIIATATARQTITSVPIYVDTTPPIIRLAYPQEDVTVGANTQKIRVEGVTDPKASVWLNDMYQPIPMDKNGGFRAEVPLKEGVNRIEIIAVDEAGNRASVIRNVTLVTQPPTLVIDNPPDNLWINKPMLSVQGVVPPGVTVLVNGQPVDVDQQGAFENDVLLQEGENVIRIEAKDAVGNVTVEERRVFLRTQPPLLSVTNLQDQMEVSDPSFILLGKTEPGTTVWVNGRQVPVDQQGGFQATVELLKGENVIRIEALDKAGNTATLVRRLTYAPVEVNTHAKLTLPSVAPENLEYAKTILPKALGGLGAGALSLWFFLFLARRSLTLNLQAERPVVLYGTVPTPLVAHYTLSRAATVEAYILDPHGQKIYTFPKRRRTPGKHLLVWNGRIAENRYAPPGEYEVEVVARALGSATRSSLRFWVRSATQGRLAHGETEPQTAPTPEAPAATVEDTPPAKTAVRVSQTPAATADTDTE